MPGLVGIDPGVRYTGLGHVVRGRWRDSTTLRGADGTAKDWSRLAAAARSLAEVASAWTLEREPDLVAVETMVDQGGRRGHSNRHTTAAVCMAVYDALVADGYPPEQIVWQDAAVVLSHGEGYGTLKYLLEVGRAGIDAPGPLNEHEASAITHASFAEVVAHAPMAGR